MWIFESRETTLLIGILKYLHHSSSSEVDNGFFLKNFGFFKVMPLLMVLS